MLIQAREQLQSQSTEKLSNSPEEEAQALKKNFHYKKSIFKEGVFTKIKLPTNLPFVNCQISQTKEFPKVPDRNNKHDIHTNKKQTEVEKNGSRIGPNSFFFPTTPPEYLNP